MMKLNRVYAIVFLLTACITYGQSEISESFTDVALPSSHAFEMTRYGNVPVDESSGRISLSIPIADYKVGTITVPISLSYAGNGVKVEQVPTWVGNSWVLNAGGVITREVNDFPDERAIEKAYYTYSDLDAMKTTLYTNEILPMSVVNKIKMNKFNDSEYDIFNFNFSNISGSFIMIKNTDGNFIPKIIKNEQNVKIEVIGSFVEGSNFEFKITTDDGTEYYFGGLANVTDVNNSGYAFEETQLTDREYDVTGESSLRAKTAFYLTKIQSYKGDLVFFEYYNEELYRVLSVTESSVSKQIFNGSFNCESPENPSASQSNSRVIRNKVYNGKFLRKIWTNQSNKIVLFNSERKTEILSSHGTMGAGISNLKYRILTNIQFNEKKVDLEYYPTYSTLMNTQKDKFFLTDVKFKDVAGNSTNEKYKLEYNDIDGVPNFLSLAQDHLGFYNGQISNTTLIPKNGLEYLTNFLSSINFDTSTAINYKNTFDFALTNTYGDREGYFNYATKGILEKIIYPTGGYTVFDYEPVDKKYTKTSKNFHISFQEFDTNHIMEDEFVLNHLTLNELGLTESIDPNLPVQQDIIINYNFGGMSTFSSHLDYRDFMYVEITDLTSNSVTRKNLHLSVTDVMNNSMNNSVSANDSFVYTIRRDRSYKFKIGFGNNLLNGLGYVSDPNNNILSPSIVGNMSFEYINGINETDGLGIRIKRVKDYASQSSTPEIKRYYYGSLDDLKDIYMMNKVKFYKPLYHSFSATYQTCLSPPCESSTPNFGPVSIYYFNYFFTLHSKPTLNGLGSSDVQNMYKNVLISFGGDNFENGGVQKAFYIDEIRNQENFKLNRENYAPLGGNPCLSLDDVFVRRSDYDYLIFKCLEQRNSNKSNDHILSGYLIKETIFENINEKLYKTKITDYQYNFTPIEIFGSISMSTQYGNMVTYIESINHVYMGTYDIGIYKPFLTSKKETTYIEKFNFSDIISTYVYHGFGFLDHDNDGVYNYEDVDYLNLYNESIVESNRKKIINIESYDYSQTNTVGKPNEVNRTSSDAAILNKTKYYYPIPSQISLVTDNTSQDVISYNKLFEKHAIAEPFLVESYQNSDLLSRQKKTYSQFPIDATRVYPNKMFSSKGTLPLELQSEIHKYDDKGNPVEISQPNGVKVVYIWNDKRQVVYKAVNTTYTEWLSNTSIPSSGSNEEPELIGPSTINPYSVLLPNAQVTIYRYNNTTNLLTSVMDPKGDVTTYHYDIFNQLQYVKDKIGNILQEYKSNYKSE